MPLTIESLAPILQGIGSGVTSVMRAKANRDAQQAQLDSKREMEATGNSKEFKNGQLINTAIDKNLKGRWENVPLYGEYGDPVMIFDEDGNPTGEQEKQSKWVAHDLATQKKNYAAAGWDWTSKRYVGSHNNVQTIEDAAREVSTFSDNDRIKRTKKEYSAGGGTGNAAESPSAFRTNQSGIPVYTDPEDGQEILVQPNELAFMQIPMTKPEDTHEAIEAVLLDELGKINSGQLDAGDASDMTRAYKAMSDATGMNEKGFSNSRAVNEWYQMLIDRMADSRIQAGTNDAMAFEATIDAVSPDELIAGAEFIQALTSGDQGKVGTMMQQQMDKMAAEHKELVKSAKNMAMPIDFDETMAEMKTPYEDPSHVVNFMKRMQSEMTKGAQAPQSINEIQSTPVTELLGGIQTDPNLGANKTEKAKIRKNAKIVDEIKFNFKRFGSAAVKNDYADEFAMFTEHYKNQNTAAGQRIPATPTRSEFNLFNQFMTAYKKGDSTKVKSLMTRMNTQMMKNQKLINENRRASESHDQAEIVSNAYGFSDYPAFKPKSSATPDYAAMNVMKFVVPWMRFQSAQQKSQEEKPQEEFPGSQGLPVPSEE